MAKVQINYKSGISMVVKCDEFTIKRGGLGKSFEWENMSPRPLLIGIEDVESVWEL